MKKIKTLKKNYEFKNVFDKGIYFVNNQVIIYILKNKYEYNRIGIAISSKLCKAVKRNRLKRLIRAAYRDYEKNLKTSYDIIFTWNKKTDISNASYFTIKENMENSFKKMGILK